MPHPSYNLVATVAYYKSCLVDARLKLPSLSGPLISPPVMIIGQAKDSFIPGNLVAGQYCLIAKLLRLESYLPRGNTIRWPRGPSPIWLDRLIPFLGQYPDQMFAAFVFRGLSFGFHIGFDRQAT